MENDGAIKQGHSKPKHPNFCNNLLCDCFISQTCLTWCNNEDLLHHYFTCNMSLLNIINCWLGNSTQQQTDLLKQHRSNGVKHSRACCPSASLLGALLHGICTGSAKELHWIKICDGHMTVKWQCPMSTTHSHEKVDSPRGSCSECASTHSLQQQCTDKAQ